MGSKTIIVVRHAKSEWGTGEPDFDRPLARRGFRDAYALGAILAPYCIDLVWCSPARRTRETWEQACAGGAHGDQVDVRRSFYGMWSESLISEMAALDESLAVLAIVNHQPTVGDLVYTLAQPSSLAQQAAEFFPTAAVAILTHAGDWGTIGEHTCTLEKFTRARAAAQSGENR
ncbi:MAG: histidine phosphatase family protein [Propionibacteriaceae bacterium]|nr:histidine phosphatase family protein [Propionibacteriaceae bacterium]